MKQSDKTSLAGLAKIKTSVLGIISLSFVLNSHAGWAQVPAPPSTRQDNVHDLIFGADIIDPYRWLEDQDAQETRDWVTAQNAYTHSFLDAQPWRLRIHQRLTEMLVHDWQSSPLIQGGYYYFDKRASNEQLSSIYRRKVSGGPDELLIDPRSLSADFTTSVQQRDVSDDGKLLIYSVRRGGEDETELRVLNTDKRQDLPDVLPRALYDDVSLKKDNSGFYYARRRRDQGPRIYFHALGNDSASDPEIFGKDFGPQTFLSAQVSEDGHYLFIAADTGWTKSELYVQNLQHPGPLTPLITGLDALFDGAYAGDSLIVRTNWKAPNWRILKIDLRDPAPEKWREIVPAGADAVEGLSVIGGKIFVIYLHNVTSRISIFSLDGHPLGQVALPSLGSAGIYGRWDRDEGVLSFSSYTTPGSIYLYSSSTGKRRLWFRSPIPFDSDRYVTRQVWYSSKDGTRVPMFLVHRKDLKPHGQTPTLLYGYGGFNVSITPNFNPWAAWFVEQGGIYAVANIRGGSEFGEAWHKAGMLDKKQNVFDDFIAAAEWLIHNGYTSPQKLAIRGASNGGLLMGAVVTQRPDLFRAVLCEYPDLDMVRYYKFTKNNNPAALMEYGNAAEPDQFKFLYAYSPYQHVRPGTAYPAMLFVSGDEDTRVPPQQARKMAARLQAATNSGYPVLLLYDNKSGHSGGKPVSKVIDDESLELAFLAWQLGM